MMLCGFGSIALGSTYVFPLFGPTEAEVGTWGRVSFFWGCVLVLLSLPYIRKSTKQGRLISGVVFGGLILLQIMPIYLWIIFHGMGISDGTPASSFVAHWMYAIPHLVLGLLGVYGLLQTMKGKQ